MELVNDQHLKIKKFLEDVLNNNNIIISGAYDIFYLYNYTITIMKEKWLKLFNDYVKINKLGDVMINQFEKIYYFNSETLNDVIIEIMMEVYYFNTNIKNISCNFNKYKNELFTLINSNTPCNYNLEYPIRLYNIIDKLPFRE